MYKVSSFPVSGNRKAQNYEGGLRPLRCQPKPAK